MKSYEHVIKEVLQDSIASEFDLEAGDVLLKINNKTIEDIFDYQYLVEDTYIEVLIRKKDGDEWLLEIDKEPDEDLGIVFENGLMDEYKSCQNKCIFCFIDQMPKGMRETLYFKDDDSRLSFLQGNYVTLTNMSDKDIDRIIQYNLGPINISVHTTNRELRCKMLNNRFAGDALNKIDRLFKGNVKMNGQIVLCKDVNDKEELARTITDLGKYIGCMESVSVVPAGLTKYRDGLFDLKSFTQKDALNVIDIIENFQQKFYNETGSHFVHASDEWYILAEKDFPEESRYDGYLQLENGVGMMRLLWEEFKEAYQNLPDQVDISSDYLENGIYRVSCATGKLAYSLIKKMADMIMDKYPNVHIDCYQITNHYFGEKITVSGLITATDLMDQLKGIDLGRKLILPCNILRSGEDVFLDDITVPQLEKELNIKVDISQSQGRDFIDAIFRSNIPKRNNNGNFVYINAFDR